MPKMWGKVYSVPLTHFKCPDGELIATGDCLNEGGCRMGSDRCATRSYLRLVSKERPWTGKPSTTQLIRGVMESWLRLTTDYATSPDSRAFMVNGTLAHARLEESSDEYSLLEEKFDGQDVDITGIADVIETENGETILVDFKTSGSFKVAKALGFKVVERPSGEFYKSGKRKGQEKTIKELVRDEQYVDRWEWEMQLNKYRIEAKKKLGLDINTLKIQCLVRDGGTYIARSRGVFRNIYYFKIDTLSDEDVLNYFERKRRALEQAIKDGQCTEACDAKENWDGLKCAKYCDVAKYCYFGKYLKQEKEEEEMAIKGLSEIRRLPRLGKIRLGIKKKTDAGKEYPSEIDYFRIDPQTPNPEENQKLCDEFAKLYGEQPKQIKIMFPLPDPNIFFPQFYKRYANGVLRCKGDGELAGCLSKEFAEGLDIVGDNELGGVNVICKGRECPNYKSKKCSEHASLSILLPDMPGAGVWEIPTGSYHSIVNVNSCIEYIRAVCGRVHMIPLMLERRSQDTLYEGKKAKHFILHVNMDFRLADLQKLEQIDATRIMLELPEPEIDKEDILFAENAVINAPPKDAIVLIDDSQISSIKMVLKGQKVFGQKAFGTYLKSVIGAESVEDIPADKYDTVVDAITNHPDTIKENRQRQPGED
jgi:hypothetical protein